MRTVRRSHPVHVLLSDHERELLVATARREEKTISEFVRETLRPRLQQREETREAVA
jgi:hypothetical protein